MQAVGQFDKKRPGKKVVEQRSGEPQAAHNAYQTAPRHEQFIAANATEWAKVRVFDADLAAWQAGNG